MNRITYAIAALFVLVVFHCSGTASASSDTQGLAISPVRQELTTVPGKASSGTITVGNTTDKSITISLSVEQFSVVDYSYDYEFRAPPSNDWVKLDKTQIEIAPNKTQKVLFSINVPNKSRPGGYYFSLFASTTLEGPGMPGTVRAASLLYLKVDGDLIRTSVMENASAPLWVTGSDIPYEFDVKNTGNVHFSAYFYGQIEWLFGLLPEVGTSHILMPGKVRTINGTVPTPLLPGIYKMTYGYKVDFADIVTAKTEYIIFIPPWSIILLGILAYGMWSLRAQLKRLFIKTKKR